MKKGKERPTKKYLTLYLAINPFDVGKDENEGKDFKLFTGVFEDKITTNVLKKIIKADAFLEVV